MLDELSQLADMFKIELMEEFLSPPVTENFLTTDISIAVKEVSLSLQSKANECVKLGEPAELVEKEYACSFFMLTKKASNTFSSTSEE